MPESVTPIGVPAPQCRTSYCERTDLIKKAGLCRRCYQLVRAGRDPESPLRNRVHSDKCSRPDCDGDYASQGLCQKHYDQARRGGLISTNGPAKSAEAEQERRDRRIAFLWENIDERGPDECWPWKGKPSPGGYGQLSWFNRQTLAHRAAYELAYGEIPDEIDGERANVDHTCHDPAVCQLKTKCPHRLCCNPAHLEVVPASVNRRRGDTSRPGNGGRHGSVCGPGCTCKRHQAYSRVGGKKCLPGCTCKRHDGLGGRKAA